MRQFLAETANIKQFVEEKYCELREAIHKIEQKLNDLTLALCHQHTPIKNVLDRVYRNFVHGTKENISRKHLITRHTNSKCTGCLTT